jgi:predicted dehydrogenase
MQIAIVGCGFVADFYARHVRSHPTLCLAGVSDRDPDRASHFGEYHSLPVYRSFDELLEDDSIDIVVNLTNPRSHFQVSRACLEADKHVYSEKPLAMQLSEARELVDLAERRGLYISSAPSTVLGESAQTLWKALREDTIGRVRLVYAELDDGLVHRKPYRDWVSESGAPWPYVDEFEVGCTIEHAAYYVTWLTAFFGPVRRITAFSSCLVPDKQTDVPLEVSAPDFSVACMTFASGVVARLTCSVVAPHDHSMTIVADEGTLYTRDCWHFDSPVYVRRNIRIRRRLVSSPWRRKLPFVRRWKPGFQFGGAQRVDFAGGVAELAMAIEGKRRCRLSARYCLHVNEIVLAIQNACDTGVSSEIKSSFEPIDPMPWAD